MEKGIYYNKRDFIDSIIVDLNNAIKELVNGQYISAMASGNSMAQKLINLRTSYDSELKKKDELIEGLKAQLRDAGVEYMEMSPEEFVKEFGEKGGADNGE